MHDVQRVLSPRFAGASAWIGSKLPADAGIVALTRECLAEITHLAKMLDENPLPALALDPLDFDLPACRDLMARAHAAPRGWPGICHHPPLAAADVRAGDVYQGLLAARADGRAAGGTKMDR